ncbi:nuclear body protein SP140-like protein isoform X1 [Seriola aureovittata]|uniref:nuclear body protein SP140-like protein isoform X1 n=1 Tax=Seriola aureovittata TaxID=2871759 RepID=UPI0024BE57B8|nr:nuclear body protein SP140-like protein isoform X1 [Seriola aureovittata]
MDPLDFLNPEQLLLFFHCHKTELSCMQNPLTFLSQLKDYNLIPDDRYQKVRRMKSKDNVQKSLYEILDWLERERSEHITLFWTCVFKETIINLYPTLRLLRNSLMDGSFPFNTQLPEKLEKEETDDRKRKKLSEEEEEQVKSTKKKRNLRSRSACDDEELQPGPSSQLTPGQKKKSKKICFSSPLKKGEQSDFWNWPLYKSQLPVTCGLQKGSLSRDRLAKGEKCILCEKQWFTPTEFEKLAGKSSSKNWKLSIRCSGTPLGKLIKEGHLESGSYKGKHKKTKRSLFPSDDVVTVSEGEEEEDDENEDDEVDLENQEDQASSSGEGNCTDEDGETEEHSERRPEGSKTVFKVTCGGVAGTLHQKRFGSGTCGKSIRTETRWLSPVEFVKEASSLPDASWKKDIEVDGRPLSVLIEAKILRIHSLLCSCRLCSPDHIDLENQKNDDECYVCKSEEAAELVVCDHCPRAFHQRCHLPQVDDATLRDSSLWMCTFCVFQTNHKCRYSDKMEMKSAMLRNISQHMLECQYLLLFLYSADEEQNFALDPNLYLENYSTVIQTPMWLGKVVDKLQTKEYQTVAEFVSDIQLIFSNCASYNHANVEFLAVGDRLKELFNGEFKKVFNICEQ